MKDEQRKKGMNLVCRRIGFFWGEVISRWNAALTGKLGEKKMYTHPKNTIKIYNADILYVSIIKTTGNKERLYIILSWSVLEGSRALDFGKV